jgi:hypothetical protein
MKLEAQKKYQGKAFPLLLEQMTTCPTNQLPMYAENALPIIIKTTNNFLLNYCNNGYLI